MENDEGWTLEAVAYFGNWRQRTFICPACGWRGLVAKMEREARRDLTTDASCPDCGKMLVLINPATGDEVREAAAAGNAEAAAMLAQVAERENNEARFEQAKLRVPGQLPDLDGDDFEFVWDQGLDERDPWRVTISLGTRLVWQEPGWYECWRRFNEVKNIFKEKYGPRFRRMTPGRLALGYLYGDDWSAPKNIEFT